MEKDTSRSRFWLLAVAALWALVVAGCPQPPGTPTPGTADETFGIDGKVTTDIIGSDDEVYGLALQTDGKIIAAGYAYNGASNYALAVARYYADGSLDTSYGTDGKYLFDDASLDDFGRAVVLQNDGMSVVAGRTGFDALLVRLDTTGVPDPLFGSSGFVVSDFGGNEGWIGLAIQEADQKLVAVGWKGPIGNSDIAVARFNTDGSPDSAFGTGGVVTLDVLGHTDQAYAVAVQPDGMIVVGGFETDADGNTLAVVARLNDDGSLDTTGFGAGGVTSFSFSVNDRVRALALQSDGKIVVAGQTDVPVTGIGILSGFVARLTEAGVLDAAFADDGNLATGARGIVGRVHSLAIGQGDRIIAAGRDSVGAQDGFGVHWFLSDGTPDLASGSAGGAVTYFGTSDAEAHAVLVDADGRTLVAGTDDLTASAADFALARYH